MLEIDPMTLALVWSYTDGRFSASNIGGAQRLPDGNTFIACRGGPSGALWRVLGHVTLFK